MNNKQTTQLFLKLPKKLLLSGVLSIEACVLYAYLLDKRMLSEHTNMQKDTFMKFLDDKGIFCLASIDELMKVIGCKNDKINKLKKELKNIGLIDERRQLIGSNKIYVYDVPESIENTGISEIQIYE